MDNTTEYTLKLDLDQKKILKNLSYKFDSFYRIFYTKREYLPEIKVDKLEKTKKGYHLTMTILLDENKPETEEEYKERILIMQDFFGSDKNRSLYDLLRIMKKSDVFNLFFDYKRGFPVSKDIKTAKKIQNMIDIKKRKYDEYARIFDNNVKKKGILKERKDYSLYTL